MIRKLGLAAETIAFVMTAASFAGSAAAQSATPASLEDQLKAQYKLAQTGRGATSSKVTEPGTVLVIKMAGIVGVSGVTEKICPAKFESGTLHKPSEMCLEGLRMMREFTRELAVGESVYVSKFEVNEEKGSVSLEIIECDSCNGVSKTSSYKSRVVIQFQKSYLKTADVTKVADVIGQVLATDTGAGVNAQAEDTPGQSSQPTDPPSAAARTTSQPAPQPETPPAPAQPIQVGQTLEQVQANTGGKFELITDLGDTKIYRYNGQRITFENGKITNIQ